MAHWAIVLFCSVFFPKNWRGDKKTKLWFHQYLRSCSYLWILFLVACGLFVAGVFMLMIPRKRTTMLYDWNNYSDNFGDFYHDDLQGDYAYQLVGNDLRLNPRGDGNIVNLTEVTLEDRLQEHDPRGMDPYPFLHYMNAYEHLIEGVEWKESTAQLRVFRNGEEIKTEDGKDGGVTIDVMKEISFAVGGKTPEKKRKACLELSHSIWDSENEKCKQQWVLMDICVVVDPVKMKFSKVKSGKSNKNGCFKGCLCRVDPSQPCPHPHPYEKNEYPIGTYLTTEYSSGNPIYNIGSVDVRHFADPWLRFYDISDGSLKFSNYEYWKLVIMTLGFFACMLGFALLMVSWCLCCKLIDLSCTKRKLK